MSDLKILDGATAVAMLRAASERVIASESVLTKADQDIGDGDHGIGMARGFKAALSALDKLGPEPSPSAAFVSVGAAVLRDAGGASGAVFGTFFQGTGKALGAGSVDVLALAQALRAGAEAVMARGKAKAGDKTMLDALLPAVDAMLAEASASLPAASKSAAAAAARGAEATGNMLAAMGRARNLGERARGHVDPGALSMRFVFEGFARATADLATS